ncbi:hypothetical protein [Almyronema epifaneia]|uniref:Uncharacterized protein n=1 Tax=Almyronema epifaneia S1 TaxID=2991925 RepID=A0ABW6IDY2_9CYAN
MEALKKLVRLGLTALQWLFALISGGLFFTSLLAGSIVAAIVALFAFGVVFPPLQRHIEAKLPVLRPRVLKLLIAWALLIAHVLVSPPAAIADICQTPAAGRCPTPETTLNADEVTTAYLVARFPKSAKATTANLELSYKASDEAAEAAVYSTSQPIDPAQPNTVQFELPLSTLPIGSYTAAIALGETTIHRRFDLTGNPPRLNKVAFCGVLEAGVCSGNYTLYLADSFPAIYVNAEPQHFRAETAIEIKLNYTPEPGKTTLLNTVSGTVKPGDTAFAAEIPLPALAVGTYAVSLSSPAKDFLAQTQTFTVWHSKDALDARADGTLADSTTQISGLKLCEQTLTPEELAQLEANADSNEVQEIGDGDRCALDTSTFASGTPTIAADVTIGSGIARTDGPLDLTFVWHYVQGPGGGRQPLITKTVPIEPDLSSFTYSLTYDGGYIPGTYEVIAFLETNDAQPLRREFVVE